MSTTITAPGPADVDAAILLEQLAVEHVKLGDVIAHARERRDEIAAILLGRLNTGTHVAGPFKIQVKAGSRRLNAKRFAEAYPVVVFPDMYSAAPDTAKAKNLLAPVVLAAFYDAGQPSVVIA